VDTYTFTAAGMLLGVTRQTIHRRVKDDPDRYTIVTPDGHRAITTQGLNELKSMLNMNISKGVRRTVSDSTSTQQTNTAGQDVLRTELSRMQERNMALESDVLDCTAKVTYLQLQLDSANKRIADLESDKQLLAGLLMEANKKIPNAVPAPRPGILARLFAGRSPDHKL